jgi:hypothetical protein
MRRRSSCVSYIICFTRGNLQGCQNNDPPVSSALAKLPQSNSQNATAKLLNLFTVTDFYVPTRLSS